MPLQPGLYRLAVTTAEGSDHGVVYAQHGKLRGGDSSLAYVGSYRVDAIDNISVQLQMTQHRAVPGIVSKLGFNNITVEMEGVVGDGLVDLRGSSRQDSLVKFSARMTLIAD